jgi:hypothetical protein
MLHDKNICANCLGDYANMDGYTCLDSDVPGKGDISELIMVAIEREGTFTSHHTGKRLLACTGQYCDNEKDEARSYRHCAILAV